MLFLCLVSSLVLTLNKLEFDRTSVLSISPRTPGLRKESSPLVHFRTEGVSWFHRELSTRTPRTFFVVVARNSVTWADEESFRVLDKTPPLASRAQVPREVLEEKILRSMVAEMGRLAQQQWPEGPWAAADKMTHCSFLSLLWSEKLSHQTTKYASRKYKHLQSSYLIGLKKVAIRIYLLLYFAELVVTSWTCCEVFLTLFSICTACVVPLQNFASGIHQDSQFLDFLKMIVYNAFLRLVLPCHQCSWSEQWREECRSLQSFPQTFSDFKFSDF